MELEEVKRLTLQPGDALVVKVPAAVSREVVTGIEAYVASRFPGHRVLVVPTDWELETIRDESLTTVEND